MIPEALGIIAGRGNYPLILARSARAQGVKRLFAVAFKGETKRELAGLVDEIHWQHVGQLERFVAAFAAFAKEGGSGAVMAGQIAPRNLFHVRFDKRMRALLAGLPTKNADTIFSAIGDELRSVGVELLPASRFMESELAPVGALTPRAPTEQEAADMDLGFEVARTTSGLKIGQTVVIKNGTILAVEAFEGTDVTIRRAGKLGGRGAVVVKVSQPGHDMRFDIPVVGLRTLKTIRKAGVTALAVEAGRTLLLDREAVLAEAARLDLAVVARELGA